MRTSGYALPSVSVSPDSLALQSRRTQRAAPVAPVATVRAAAGLDGHEEVVVRPHLEPQMDGDTLRSRAGEVPLGAAETELVSSLLSAGTAPVRDLGLDLARRLLLGGIVTLDDAAGDDRPDDELSHP